PYENQRRPSERRWHRRLSWSLRFRQPPPFTLVGRGGSRRAFLARFLKNACTASGPSAIWVSSFLPLPKGLVFTMKSILPFSARLICPSGVFSSISGSQPSQPVAVSNT